MTSPLHLLAAGSLKSALVPLLARFQARTGLVVNAGFGPAGLLRERIENGEQCDIFASANTCHPQALLASGMAHAVQTFALNRLNLTVRRMPKTESADWLSLLTDASLRLGTSTPGCDPSGDYSEQLFARVERDYPGVGQAIAARAIPLVGGRDSLTVPPGEIAAAWLLRNNLAELFVGYAHYAQALPVANDLRIIDIPADYNPRCEYQLARLSQTEAAVRLAAFILSAEGQGFLRQAGFMALDSK